MKEQALLALQGPRPPRCWRRSRPACRELSFMQGGAVPHRRPAGVDQPLGLYRRGRVRDFGRQRALSSQLSPMRSSRDERGQADRPRRARFAAARGRPAALRPRPRPRRHAGHGRPAASPSASAAAPRAASPARMRILAELENGAAAEARRLRTSTAASRCARARWSSTAKAMKSAGSPAAASRPRCSGRSPWAMSPPRSPSRAPR